MHPHDFQELIHWQYLHGLDIEPVYWLAQELCRVNPRISIICTIECAGFPIRDQ